MVNKKRHLSDRRTHTDMDVINDYFWRFVREYFIGLTNNSGLHSEDFTYEFDIWGLGGFPHSFRPEALLSLASKYRQHERPSLAFAEQHSTISIHFG